MRRALMVILALLLVSPLFGVIGASITGYHEPLDIAAEALGLEEVSLYHTPFEDYTFPGLPDTLGYIASGALGVALILLIGLLLRRVGARGERR